MLWISTVGIMLSGSGFSAWSIGHVGIFSIAIFISYCIATKVIYNFEKRKGKKAKPDTGYRIPDTKYSSASLKQRPTKKADCANGDNRPSKMWVLSPSCIIIVNLLWIVRFWNEHSHVFKLTEKLVRIRAFIFLFYTVYAVANCWRRDPAYFSWYAAT